jgi:mannose-6-phosphate isomerase
MPFAKGTMSFESQNATITNMLRNKYFQLDLIDIRSALEMDAKGDRFYILYVVKGEACIAYDHGVLSAKLGESILIPAALGRYAITGECRLLKMYIPAD